MSKGFLSTPRGAFLGCLGFVALGVFLFSQSRQIDKYIGAITIFVFGAGACILLWNIIRGPRSVKILNAQTRLTHISCASSIEEILVNKEDLEDIEVLEHWVRVGDNLNASFQAVSATKSDSEEFAWGVSVWAGEFFIHGKVADVFNDEIYSSLSSVAGVRSVGREDKEHWAVDGECSGKYLVQAAAFANDRVIDRYQQGDFK